MLARTSTANPRLSARSGSMRTLPRRLMGQRSGMAVTRMSATTQAGGANLDRSLLKLKESMMRLHEKGKKGMGASSPGKASPMDHQLLAFLESTPAILESDVVQYLEELSPAGLRAMMECEVIWSESKKKSPRHELLTLPELVSIGKTWPLLRFLYPERSPSELVSEECQDQYGKFLDAIQPSLRELTFSNGSRTRASNLQACLECMHAMLMVGRVPSIETWFTAIEATAVTYETLLSTDRRLWAPRKGKKDTTLHPAAMLGHCLARLDSEPGIADQAPAVVEQLMASPRTARLVTALAGVLNAYTCDGEEVMLVPAEQNLEDLNSSEDEQRLLGKWIGPPEEFVDDLMKHDSVRNEYLPSLYALAVLSMGGNVPASSAAYSPWFEPQVVPVYPGLLIRRVSMASYRPHICHSRATTNLAWAQLATVLNTCLSTEAISEDGELVQLATLDLAEVYKTPSDSSKEDSFLGELGPHEVAMWGSPEATKGWVEGLQSWTLDVKPVGKSGSMGGSSVPKFPPDTADKVSSVMPSVLAALVEIGGYLPVAHRSSLVDALDRAVVAWQGSLPDHKLGPLMSSLGRMRRAAADAEEADKGQITYSLAQRECNMLTNEIMKRCWPETDETPKGLFESASEAVGMRHGQHMAGLKSGGLARELMRLGILPEQ